MKNRFFLLAAVMLVALTVKAQDDHIVDGMTSVAAIAGETKTVADSAAAPAAQTSHGILRYR